MHEHTTPLSVCHNILGLSKTINTLSQSASLRTPALLCHPPYRPAGLHEDSRAKARGHTVQVTNNGKPGFAWRACSEGKVSPPKRETLKAAAACVCLATRHERRMRSDRPASDLDRAKTSEVLCVYPCIKTRASISDVCTFESSFHHGAPPLT
jgi:hypothetical protein